MRLKSVEWAARLEGSAMVRSIAENTPINAYLSFKISVLYRLMVRRTARFLHGHYGLTVAQWWALGQLAVRSPGTVSSIADDTQNDKAQVSRAVAILIQKGLVRKVTDAKDKRRSLLSLTERGAALYREVLPIRQKTQELLLAQLTAEEQEVTIRAIDKLTAMLLEQPEMAVAVE
ncbi:MAG: MarR family transcriptional regulator [Cellvibrionales bacterium]|nr:MarR family transcriptional regulator [Cellvibrionales bacterium]